MSVNLFENGELVKVSGGGGGSIATSDSPGIVQPDNSTINVDANGVISSFSGSYNDLTNKPTLGTAASKEVDTEVRKNSTNLITSGGVFNALIPLKELYPWSTATDEQITSMIERYYNGALTLDDIKAVWTIGDTRNITVSAMSATGVGESHREQVVQMEILDFDHDILTTPINGKTKALITVETKSCLMAAGINDTNGSSNSEHGYMNSSNTNVGGWKDCARRTWCNSVFYNTLPSYFKSLVKQVNKLSSAGNQSSTIDTTADYVFLPSEIEIFGSVTYSKAGEGTQYAWYANATANRNKSPHWSSSYMSDVWWERSPLGSNATSFCRVNVGGSATGIDASRAAGLSPACCL